MNWLFTCLTPVHIGTGRDLQPYEYEVSNGRYTVFSLEAALRVLAREDQRLVEEYSRYAEEILVSGSTRAQNGKRLEPRDASVVGFCSRKLGNRALARRLRETPGVVAYTADGVTWRPNGQRRQVREQIKLNGRPYLPGSSVKGAIRVALAYDMLLRLPESGWRLLLDGDPARGIRGVRQQVRALKQAHIRLLDLVRRRDPKVTEEARALSRRVSGTARHIGDAVDQVLFRWGRSGKRGVQFGDPQQDLLRALRVSDSLRSRAALTVVALRSVAKEGGEARGREGAPIVAEAIDQDSVFELELQLDAHLLRGMARAAARDRKEEWLEFDEKFRLLFGRDASELRALESDAELNAWADEVLRDLLARTRPHAKAVLRHDRAWLERHRRASAGLVKRWEKLQERIKTGNLLRAGYASGWHATTVALSLKEKGFDDLLSDLVYVFRLDLSPKLGGVLKPKGRPDFGRALDFLMRRPDVDAFPASRRLVVEDGELVDWMGWLDVSVGSLGKDEQRAAKEATEASPEDTGEQIDAETLRRLRAHFGGEWRT